MAHGCAVSRSHTSTKQERERHSATCREWQQKHPGYSTDYGRAYRALHPERYAAAKRVRSALRSGLLQRPNYCQHCGKGCRPDAHHADYARPLEVTWLCRRCHRSAHTHSPDSARARLSAPSVQPTSRFPWLRDAQAMVAARRTGGR